jgi:hypothetical protein
MYPYSRGEVPPIVRNTIGTSKLMITVFLWGEGSICVDTHGPSETLTQDYFINFVLSDPKNHKQSTSRRKHRIELIVHVHDSRCHSGQKVVDKMRRNHMKFLDHPPSSHVSSPCDFEEFRALKNYLNETVFRNPYEVEDLVCNFRSDVTLDEMQLVFHERMRRLERVCEHNGEYVPE